MKIYYCGLRNSSGMERVLAPWHITYITNESSDDKLGFASLLTRALTPPDKLMVALGQLQAETLVTLHAVQPIVLFPLLQKIAQTHAQAYVMIVCAAQNSWAHMQ
jgi:hypothetical protein